jgi:hypothetical protein
MKKKPTNNLRVFSVSLMLTEFFLRTWEIRNTTTEGSFSKIMLALI